MDRKWIGYRSNSGQGFSTSFSRNKRNWLIDRLIPIVSLPTKGWPQSIKHFWMYQKFWMYRKILDVSKNSGCIKGIKKDLTTTKVWPFIQIIGWDEDKDPECQRDEVDWKYQFPYPVSPCFPMIFMSTTMIVSIATTSILATLRRRKCMRNEHQKLKQDQGYQEKDENECLNQ